MRLDRNSISGLEVFHVSAERLDNATEFMPENLWDRCTGEGVAGRRNKNWPISAFVKIAPADAAKLVADEHLVGTDIAWLWDIVDTHVPARVKTCGFHPRLPNISNRLRGATFSWIVAPGSVSARFRRCKAQTIPRAKAHHKCGL